MKKFGQFNEAESVDEAASMMKVIGAKTVHRKKYKKALDFIRKKLKTVEHLGATKVFRVSKIVDKYSLPIDAKVAYELLQKESVNTKLAREKIRREKEADKEKHDRMMDQARTRDTRMKNRTEAMAVQDPDIKDREGSQPAAYHKGLKKTTKAKRDAHFKKHGPKSDSDDSAYADAPGDKKARKNPMKVSKYTDFVNKMMDEEHEFHVRLDHLDGDKRQDKAGNVLRKHEKAGHIKFHGNTDKGVVFKAKSKSHADRLHKDLKPHATGVEHMNEAAEYHVTRPGGSLKKPDSVHQSKTDAMKSAYRLSGNKHKGDLGGQVYRVNKGSVTHGFDTEGRVRHLGLDHAKMIGKKSISEAEYDPSIEQISENSFAEKSKKSGISVATLRKVYNRGVAAWKTGHRPGTTPQQWGHARVNAFITKKKKGGLNHDKDLA